MVSGLGPENEIDHCQNKMLKSDLDEVFELNTYDRYYTSLSGTGPRTT